MKRLIWLFLLACGIAHAQQYPYSPIPPAYTQSSLPCTNSTGAPLWCTLGTGLSISAGVLSATGGSSLAFSGLTSATNTAAAMLVGTGASLGTTGSGTLTASGANALAITPAMQSYTTIVSPLQFGAICNGSSGNATADTTGVQDAVNHIANNGTVQLPPGSTCYLNSTISVTGSGVRIVGGGHNSTIIQYVPSANGPVFQFYSGSSSEAFNNALIGVGINSTDTTYTKTAILMEDQGEFTLDDIMVGVGGTKWNGGSATTNPCNSTTDAQAGSIALRNCGRDNNDLSRLYFTADRNIVLSPDPNVTTESIDHNHFKDLYLVNVAGTLNPLVWVDPTTVLTNLTFDGFEAWVGGSYGFYMSTTTETYGSYGLEFDNIRWEQGTSPQYMAYFSSNTELQNIIFRNANDGVAASGWYCHGCYNFYLDSPNMYGGGTDMVTIDSSDFNVCWQNAKAGSGVTNSLTTQTLMFGVFLYPNTTIPVNACYNRTGEISGTTIGTPLTFTTQTQFTQPNSWTTAGYYFSMPSGTVTDATATGTVTTEAGSAFGAPTIAAANAGVTITNLANVYLAAPVAGTNVTATNLWSLYTAGGIYDAGNLSVGGTFKLGSNTLTLGGPLTTTGSGSPTLAFGSNSPTLTMPTDTSTIAQVTDVQTFTSTGSGTWTKPGGSPKTTRVIMCGGGGGGGSGSDLAATTAGAGGGGGGGAACWEAQFNTAQLGSTETLNVGAGGTAGAAVTSTSAGNPGGVGGNTSFGTTSYFTAFGGGAGQGGASAANSGGGGGGSMRTAGVVGSGGTGGSGDVFNGGSGGTGQGGGNTGTGSGGGGDTSAAAGSNGGYILGEGASGGGAGGGVTAATAAQIGGNGGAGITSAGTGGVAAGGAICTIGTAGTILNSAIYSGGIGGGGGGGCTSATAGTGGVGINGGGGGGGGAGDGHTSGAGGVGGNGFIIVITSY
jgi:hypothetical protein